MIEAQPFRLEAGGLIDRTRPLRFSFNGRAYEGYEGDTLASALLANGVKMIARSFKYHRPRGVYSCGEEEPCALVELGQGAARTPNCRAPAVPLHDSLVARSQTGWPSVDFDIGRVIDFTHGLWPAGFYNKTFIWPSWHVWEGLIRRTTGLGRPPKGPDPDRYERMNWHCDLLICGGGPVGLLAAQVAARAGLQILMAEQDWLFGGSLISEGSALNGLPGIEWVKRVVRELESLPNVLMLPRTTVTGVYDHNVTTMIQAGHAEGWRECFWTVRPKKTLLASGAIEQGLIFPKNDRPGIMLAGAVRSYLRRYAVIPGDRVIVAANNDSAYRTALDLVDADADVAAVVDTRAEIDTALARRLADAGIELLAGARVRGTHGTRGIDRVRIERSDGSTEWHECNLLAVSGGWAPRAHLLAHAGGRLRFDPVSSSFIPDVVPDAIHVAGSVTGPASLSDALEGACQAAKVICKALGQEGPEVEMPSVSQDAGSVYRTHWTPPEFSWRRQWIDLAHDVTVRDAKLAVNEGYESVEHYKRYTTAGMSVDQGKTSNTGAFLVLSALAGRAPDEIGTTTFRPPYVPVTLGAIAAQRTGAFYAPCRYLSAHIEHEALGAHFVDYGWQRPECYPQAGESVNEASLREAANVRSSVGVFDNSPIGKLEVCGPDAADFLDRLYINNLRSLQPGRSRYAMMLNENGVIVDDGVIVRIAENHFIVHTTSGNVRTVAETMEEWLQCEWADLRVVVHDATSQWANFTVAGPHARDTLESLSGDIDLSGESLPHMACVTGKFTDVPARIARVSYSGELSFEISVPARCGARLFRAILDAGKAHGITPFGVEALMVLRTEKGYLHVGTDTDGSSTPDDVGWGRVARTKERDYIGKRSLSRPANVSRHRRQLVGLQAIEKGQSLTVGGHLLIGEDRVPPADSDGWITSACYSPALERHIGLALLRCGREQHGQRVTVCDESRRYGARVVPPAFYDPENQRLEGVSG